MQACSIRLVKDSMLQTKLVLSVIDYKLVLRVGNKLVKDLPSYLNALLSFFSDERDLKSNSVTTRVKYFTVENLTSLHT